MSYALDNCFNCKSTNSIRVDFKAGQVACTLCGAVQDDRVIDETQEWRNFGSENTGNSNNDQNRCGAPTSEFDTNNLTTSIAVKSKNNPLGKFTKGIHGNNNSTFNRGSIKINELATFLDLHPRITDKAKENLKKVEESKKLKGRSLEAVVAAILYISCKQCNAPKDLKEMTKVLNLDKRDVTRCFSSINMIIDTGKGKNDYVKQNILGLVRKYCNVLELPPKLIQASNEIAEKICNIGVLDGKSPRTIAGTSILHAVNIYNFEKKGKKQISEASNTTENTVTHAYNEIFPYASQLIPSTFNAIESKTQK